MVYKFKFTSYDPTTGSSHNLGLEEFRGSEAAVENALIKKAKGLKEKDLQVQVHVMSITLDMAEIVENDNYFQTAVDTKVNGVKARVLEPALAKG